jgi:hypothetical protein
MSGQKIIEASLLTSVVFIIRKQCVKLIIYAQGTFCLCAFLKRQFPEQPFFPKMLMTVRQGKSGQNIIGASSSTSVLLIIRKQYEKLIIYAQGTFALWLYAHSLKDNFLSNIFSLVSMKARRVKERQGKSLQKIIEAFSFTSVLFIIRKHYVKLTIYAQGSFSLCAFFKRQFLEQHFCLKCR